MTRLNEEQAAAYWQERHATSDPWRAGGDRGLSERANEAFYYLRFGLLLRLLVKRFGPDRDLRLLDAGCGRGWLTGHLKQLGHDVVGVDVSEAAVGRARETYDAEFHISPLDQFDTPQRFDAIVSMDVLYHITDDDQWERSFQNLNRLLGDGGVLIFSGCLGTETQLLGDYVVHRSLGEHERVLRELGLRIVASEPYRVFSAASLHLCERYSAR